MEGLWVIGHRGLLFRSLGPDKNWPTMDHENHIKRLGNLEESLLVFARNKFPARNTGASREKQFDVLSTDITSNQHFKDNSSFHLGSAWAKF